MKIDLHIHTTQSSDSWIIPEKLPDVAKRKGLGGIAVTDHDSITAWGAVERAARKAGISVIRGEEVGVRPAGRRVGEIIGLFMTDFVDGRGKGAVEVIDELKAQGALVVLPHPFDRYRRIFPEDELRELAVKVDAVEAFNSRVFFKEINDKAMAFADEFGLAKTAGSDAHASWEVGKAYTEANAHTPEQFRKALLSGKAKIHGTYHPFYTRIFPSLAKLRSKLLGKKRH